MILDQNCYGIKLINAALLAKIMSLLVWWPFYWHERDLWCLSSCLRGHLVWVRLCRAVCVQVIRFVLCHLPTVATHFGTIPARPLKSIKQWVAAPSSYFSRALFRSVGRGLISERGNHCILCVLCVKVLGILWLLAQLSMIHMLMSDGDVLNVKL